MPAEIPTKAPIAPPDKPAEKAFDRFHPEMPRIPGVAGTPNRSFPNPAPPASIRLIQLFGAAAGAVVLMIAIFWWARSAHQPAPNATSRKPAATESPVSSPPPLAPIPNTSGDPAIVASSRDLSKPWMNREFVYVRPLTRETVHAMVIRLPGGSLWAFSLQEPYGQCKLEFVTNLGQLAAKYGYHASHPMVVNPCNSTVYDPLKVGSLGGNTWARGEIVQGQGMRPPLSIDVVVRGHSIIADRME